MTAAELRRDWIQEATFLKSVEPKKHSGMVLSPVQKIDQEWRFFLVDGQVVAGSQYRHDGVRRLNEPVAPAVWEQARRLET